ncbi:hypothetical protein WJX72_001969 [[Myrmecia] bisecta]|uniref:PhoD-like phosphatase domain-containing protein n=1 Tax=[Myrmecia] bisecta TaxID=41462 RepID=A0AAW1R4W3_9CHLO
MGFFDQLKETALNKAQEAFGGQDEPAQQQQQQQQQYQTQQYQQGQQYEQDLQKPQWQQQAGHATFPNPAATTYTQGPQGDCFGPFLRFQELTPGRQWHGSVLFVVSERQADQVTLTYDAGNGAEAAEGSVLETCLGYAFWRFELCVPVGQQERSVTYWLEYTGERTSRYTFYVAGEEQPVHWGFHSCNGWQHDFVDMEKYGDITPLWKDVMRQHSQKHMHALVGGGDQLYNDSVFELPEMEAWLAVKDPKQRTRQPFTREMEAAVARYYFGHYAQHFATEAMGDAFASIPNVMSWDDHDIFDGFGSYPEYLQNCEVFQGVYQQARHFYLLFQQHTTMRQASRASLFGRNNTFSFLGLLGSHLAVLMPDSRSERSQTQIVSRSNWDLIFERLEALPRTVRQLVVVCPVPIVYPEIVASEDVLNLFSTSNRSEVMDFLMTKTGLRSSVLSKFDEPELSDDIGDHWTSANHRKERIMVIERLQLLAQSRQMRISFLSGDVHVCGAGMLESDPRPSDKREDFRYMPQVISSAIGNTPPPTGVVTALEMCKKEDHVTPSTVELMIDVFSIEYPDFKSILPRRNWCEVFERPDGDLRFQLRVEDDPMKKQQPVRTFDIDVPALAGSGGAPYGGSYAAAQRPQAAYAAQQYGSQAGYAKPSHTMDGGLPGFGGYGQQSAGAYGQPHAQRLEDTEQPAYGHHSSKPEGRRQDDDEQPAYGGYSSKPVGRRHDDQEQSGYSGYGSKPKGRRQDDDEQPAYGGYSSKPVSRRHDDQEQSGYGGYGSKPEGRRHDDDEQPAFGGGYSRQHEGRRYDDDADKLAVGGYSHKPEGRRKDDDELSGYGRKHEDRPQEADQQPAYGGYAGQPEAGYSAQGQRMYGAGQPGYAAAQPYGTQMAGQGMGYGAQAGQGYGAGGFAESVPYGGISEQAESGQGSAAGATGYGVSGGSAEQRASGYDAYGNQRPNYPQSQGWRQD